MKIVAGLFETTEQAEQAVQALGRLGLGAEDIGVAMRDDTRDPNAEDIVEGRVEGAEVGALGGGLLGALGGLAVGVSAFVIPGIGLALVVGTIASAVIGGAVGAAAGGLLGALIDAGLSDEEARHYHSGIERGGVLVTVHTPEAREAEVQAIFRQNGMRDLDYHRNLWDEDPSHRYDARSATAR